MKNVFVQEVDGIKQPHWPRIIGSLTGGTFGAIIISILWPFVQVDAGHRGVVLNFGSVQETVMNEGLHFRVPIQQRVIVLDVRTVKHEVRALAYSKDIQTVDATVALNYHIQPDTANKLIQEIGQDFEVRVIDPAIQESVKAATALFTAQELIELRPKVKDEIRTQLIGRLEGRHIIVDDFSIVNFDFSDEYEQAVEAKQVAQQSALKAENDLKRIKTEAEQRVAQATAEAQAIRIQSEGIARSGGAEYVQLRTIEAQLKAIEKWNGVLPQQFVPGSAIPFLELLTPKK